MIIISRYLAQNAAIWLADEVLRYRDHDTWRCQDDISWHSITQQSKRRLHIYYERVNFIACFQIICWFLQTLNYRGNCKTKQIYLVRDHRIMTLDSN